MGLCSWGSLEPDGLIALKQTAREACVVSPFQKIYQKLQDPQGVSVQKMYL